MVRALWRAGVDAEAVDIDDIWTPRGFEGDVVSVTTPNNWHGMWAGGKFWGLTMWETNRCPPDWVEKINRYSDGVITPSAFCKRMFEESGVEVPVHVVPLGVDCHEFPYMERPERNPYTFLILGELGGFRKGWAYAYQAFWQAFQGDPRARLIFKTRGDRMLADCSERNVEIIDAEYGWPMIRELYQRADCFVFPSTGEGFGLPPREAAATGLPVIATDWSGLQEGGIENYAYPLRVKQMQTALYGPEDIRGQCGEWAEPDVDHLAELMTFCFENQELARAKGKAASEWIRGHCRWDVTAKQLLEVVN